MLALMPATNPPRTSPSMSAARLRLSLVPAVAAAGLPDAVLAAQGRHSGRRELTCRGTWKSVYVCWAGEALLQTALHARATACTSLCARGPSAWCMHAWPRPKILWPGISASCIADSSGGIPVHVYMVHCTCACSPSQEEGLAVECLSWSPGCFHLRQLSSGCALAFYSLSQGPADGVHVKLHEVWLP